jgi:F-type H+-transporting ATPase subunit b
MLRLDWNLLFTVINLLLLFVLMKIFLFKPVQKIIAARQAEADKQFDEAAAKQAEADGLKAQYAKSIASVEEEKSKAMQETMKKADAEYQRIVGDAESKAKQIKEDAAVEAEKTQILKKAEKEIADMVVDAAVKVVGKNSGADVDSSLYNEFLDKAGDKQ